MKNGWAAGAPEFGKLIVPSVAFWPEAGDATSQHTNPSSNGAPTERRRVNGGAPQPLNRDLTLMVAMRISSTTLPSPPTKFSKHTEPCLERRQYHSDGLAHRGETLGATLSGYGDL